MNNVEAAREKLQVLAKHSIAFRLLDAFLTHAPTIEGVDVIAGDILAASTQPDGFEQLADLYKINFLLPSTFPVMTDRYPLNAYPAVSESRWSNASGFVSSFAR